MRAPRIAFLCSGLEPGRDGVGDYARCLAGELRRRGCEASLAALNDGCVGETRTDAQEVSGRVVEALRLPRSLPWARRIALARDWVASADPDWVSLQFVCFGFHPKGLVGGLPGRLARIVAARPLQVMMHETWVGGAVSSSLRHRALGSLQKRLVLSLLRRARPRVVHTQTALHAAMLARGGIAARRLPLFSSIPVRPRDSAAEALGRLRENGWPDAAANRDGWWIFCHFGTLHPEFEAEPLMGIVRKRAGERGRRCLFLFVGNAGPAGEGTIARLRRDHGAWAGFHCTGAEGGAAVSAWMNAADFGLTGGIPELIEKSSSVAALLGHGLPVLVARSPLTWRGVEPPMPDHPLLIWGEALARFHSVDRRAGDPAGLRQVAGRFLDDLGIAAPEP
jgi:hypothetical protein